MRNVCIVFTFMPVLEIATFALVSEKLVFNIVWIPKPRVLKTGISALALEKAIRWVRTIGMYHTFNRHLA